DLQPVFLLAGNGLQMEGVADAQLLGADEIKCRQDVMSEGFDGEKGVLGPQGMGGLIVNGRLAGMIGAFVEALFEAERINPPGVDDGCYGVPYGIKGLEELIAPGQGLDFPFGGVVGGKQLQGGLSRMHPAETPPAPND